MGSAMDIIQNRGTTSSGTTAGQSPTALSIIQQYGNKQPTITNNSPKASSSQVKVTQAPKPTPTPTPQLTGIQKAQKTLGDITGNIGKTIQNVVKGINMTLTTPKAQAVKTKPPVSAVAPSAPIQIKPGQKRIDLEQLGTQQQTSAQLTPQAQKTATTQLKTAPGIFANKIIEKVGNENIYVKGTNVGTVKGTLSDIGAILSMNTFPEDLARYNKLDGWSKLSEATKAFGALLPMSSMKIPSSIEGAKDAMSAIRGIIAGYGAGTVLNYASQEPKKRSIGEAIKPNIDNLLFAYFTGSTGLPNPFEFLKKQPEISKPEYIKARDFLKEMGVKESSFGDEAALKKEFFDLAMKNHPDKGGNTATMAKINDAFRIVKNTFYDVAKTGDKTKIAGLLGDGEKTPQEIVNTVMQNGLEKTPEGKAVLKAAAEANSKGMNITIEKPVEKPSTPQGGVVKPVTVENIRKYMENPKTVLSEETVSNLKTNPVGVDELKFDKDNKITVYREGEITPGKPTSFSLEKKVGQTPFNLSKNEIILNTTSPKLAELYSQNYSQKERDIYLDTLKKWNTLESEIIAIPKEVKPKTVSVPREQLPVGEGEIKATTLEARIKGAQELVKGATPEQLDALGLSRGNTAHNDQQLADAAKYVANNQEDAIRVLKGEIEAPKGLLRNAILSAMVDQGNKDAALAAKLSGLFSERYGQEIQILSTINPNSPVKLMSELYKVRAKAFEKRYAGKKASQVKKAVVENIKKQVKAPDKGDWNSFLNSIEC